MKPATGLPGFIARVFSNEYRDSFTVQLVTTLLLANFGIVGLPAKFLSFIFRGVLGVFLEEGIFKIDVALDSFKEGQKYEQFKVLSMQAYRKATAKIYDEEKKNEIRKEYLKIIALIGAVGNGPRP